MRSPPALAALHIQPAEPRARTHTYVSDSTTHRYSSEFMAVFRSLIACTFILFGPVVVRQLLGIPMGGSPAPFIANLFLGWYEYRFLSQPTITRTAVAILRQFRFSKRFLDDLSSFNNAYLTRLLYVTDTLHGLHGLYPRCLNLSRQQHRHLPANHLPFLDILLVTLIVPVKRGRSITMVSRITTRLYDKRDQPAFASVRLSRFVAADSSVNEAAKRNILTGQFHRLRCVILDYDNFCCEMGRLIRALVDSGYDRGTLESVYHNLLSRFPQLYFRDRHALAAAHRAFTASLPPATAQRPALAAVSPPPSSLFDLTVRYTNKAPTNAHAVALPRHRKGRVMTP